MDQSTPSFPKDEDFHHVPNDDGPSRQQSGYRGSADSKGTNAGNKNGSAYDSGKKTNGYESGKGTSTNGASKGSSSQNASKGETKGKDVDSKGSMSEENDMWDKKFEAQSGKQADPLASLDSIGDFFNEYVCLPSCLRCIADVDVTSAIQRYRVKAPLHDKIHRQHKVVVSRRLSNLKLGKTHPHLHLLPQGPTLRVKSSLRSRLLHQISPSPQRKSLHMRLRQTLRRLGTKVPLQPPKQAKSRVRLLPMHLLSLHPIRPAVHLPHPLATDKTGQLQHRSLLPSRIPMISQRPKKAVRSLQRHLKTPLVNQHPLQITMISLLPQRRVNLETAQPLQVTLVSHLSLLLQIPLRRGKQPASQPPVLLVSRKLEINLRERHQALRKHHRRAVELSVVYLNHFSSFVCVARPI